MKHTNTDVPYSNVSVHSEVRITNIDVLLHRLAEYNINIYFYNLHDEIPANPFKMDVYDAYGKNTTIYYRYQTIYQGMKTKIPQICQCYTISIIQKKPIILIKK